MGTDDSENVPTRASEPPNHLTFISTAEKYDVPLRKVVPSFIELVIREEPLTEVEIANLSTLTVHRLAGAHEDYLRKTAREAHSDPHSVAKIIVRDIWPEAKKKNGQ